MAGSPPSSTAPPSDQQQQPQQTRARSGSTASRASAKVREIPQDFQESNPPEGFFAAAADIASSLVAGAEPKPSSKIPEGKQNPRVGDDETSSDEKHPDANGSASGKLFDGSSDDQPRVKPSDATGQEIAPSVSQESALEAVADGPYGDDAHLFKDYENGYHFPPKYDKKDSFRQGLVGFWKYFTTPLGFFITIYGLNIVAWGGMLFLLLCNASPAMCYPSCEDIDSPRRKWIEWDSQILNSLFCVTGFGLAPWRLRDTYYLLQFRICKNHMALRRLAGIHRGWFRLPGSQDLPADVGPAKIPDGISRDAIPYPEDKIPDVPLTGIRAPPTQMWRLDYVLWMNMWNSFFQWILSGFMWGMTRYTRPSWATGLFVALACIVGAMGGLEMFFQGKNVKKIEGVPLTDEDREKLARDREQGVYHYNNIKAKKPKEKQEDVEANTEKGPRKRYLGLGRKKGKQ